MTGMHYVLLAFACFCGLNALAYLLELRKRARMAQTGEASEPR